MKILISESQYVKMVMELRNHPNNHDIEQRNHRMDLLNKGISVILDYKDFKLITRKGESTIRKPIGNVISEVVGNYVLTPDVATIINKRLDNIYKYDYPRVKSYAILVYDFLLDSKDVLNNKIVYNGEPDDRKVREHVLSIMKKRSDYGATVSFTGYEPDDKKDPQSSFSDKHRAHYLVLLVDRNDAITVMLTSKNQWDSKTYYGYFNQPIQEYIRYDQIGSHATPLPSYKKELESDNEKKTKDVTNPDEKLTPLNVLKEVKESWIMEWINSTNK
jgi:hypothetical protein